MKFFAFFIVTSLFNVFANSSMKINLEQKKNCSEVFNGLNSDQIKTKLAAIIKDSSNKKEISIYPVDPELDPNLLGDIGKEIIKEMDKRMIGHDQVKFDLAQMIQKAYLGTLNRTRPVGNIILLGITGTGKSLAAEALHESLGLDPSTLIYIDCSEMQRDHEISKLTGATASYTGHKDTEPLVTSKRLEEATSKKYGVNVVLVDEVEKASPALLKLFLGVLDKGRLSTGDNKNINFKNSIIIFTSNLGQSEMNKVLNEKFNSIGFSTQNKYSNIELTNDRIKEAALDAVKNHLSPEFRNRIDKTYVFIQHTDEEAEQILNLTLSLAQRKNFLENPNARVMFNLTQEARSYLLKHGYSTEFGGRSIKKSIETYVIEPLTNMLSSKQLEVGDVINIGIKQGEESLSYQKVASGLTDEDFVKLYNEIYNISLTDLTSEEVKKAILRRENTDMKLTETLERITIEKEETTKLDIINNFVFHNSLSSSHFLSLMNKLPNYLEWGLRDSDFITNEMEKMGIGKWEKQPFEPLILTIILRALENTETLYKKDSSSMNSFLKRIYSILDSSAKRYNYSDKFKEELKRLYRLKHERVMNLEKI